jgi:hypothetical protein
MQTHFVWIPDSMAYQTSPTYFQNIQTNMKIVSSYGRGLYLGKSLPQSLYLPMEFSVGICIIIPLVINLPMKLPMKLLRR